ncbi:hypothetical protein LJ756_00020 [Arthrobacter sp. zg-Y411]|uniref:hypothetical protein n=1 Tax=Arthrobacter zhangbolii TaxID=2886936 RepID=UPI001D14B3CE|nr:hypothetical protein [Arthrobacter zhangbolii]MCC3293008.1 hypothetical protein [Arthrobacter zhangbolii]
MRTRKQVPSDWSAPAKPSLAVKTQERQTEITSLADEHFYVTFRRDDRKFDTRPVRSSISYEPGQAVDVSIEAYASEGMTISYIIVEYTNEGRKTFSYPGPQFVHGVSAAASVITLAVRAEGRGNLTLGDVSTKVYRRATEWAATRDVYPGDLVSLRISAFSVGDVPDGAVLTSATFKDASGTTLPPLGDSAINPVIGAYKYVEYGHLGEAKETSFELTAPAAAASVTFNMIEWKPGDVYMVDVPTVGVMREERSNSTEESISDFLQSIPDDDTLIVLYTTAPQLGHPTLALRPNRLTKEYLKLGCWVVFFPFSRVPVGEECQGERVRQYSRDHVSEFLTAACARTGKNNVFICSSFPDIVAVGAVDLLALHHWTTVYEVRDDMEEFNRVGYSKWFHPQLENRVANRVEKVITVSPRLAGKMDILRHVPGHAAVVPNAVDADFVELAENNRSDLSYVERSTSKTVGYIGHLTSSWFDWPLTISIAEQLPDVTFEIIGHGLPDGLRLPANIEYLGPKTHQEFREIAMNWKVGIIPFKPSTLTYAVDPNKVYEYLAVGLRTVTARMGSVHLCPSTWVYDDAEGFKDSLVAALEAPFSSDEVATIRSYLETATWSMRAEQMLEIFRGTDD